MAETIDTILERMLLQIPSRYDTSSGTYTYDIEKSTAMEFENVYDIISSLIFMRQPLQVSILICV